MRHIACAVTALSLLGACASPDLDSALDSLPSRSEVTAPILYGKAAWRAREYRVAPGERVRVAGHVWIAETCKLEERAEIVTLDPPKHGRLEVGALQRPVTEVYTSKKWAHCAGRKVPVTAVWYTAPRDFRGRDAFAYERVRPSTGERDLVVVDVIVE